MEKVVFRSLNKWSCVLGILEVGGTAALRCMRGSKAEETWRLALGKETEKAMNLTLLAGRVKRSKL